jgi:hypothetical protein
MTIRLSTGMRNVCMGDGTNKGVGGVLALGFISIYQGTQPASPDTGATGTVLGLVTLNGDGSTGLSWEVAAAGVLSKDTDEVWQFTGLANGVAGWFRCWPAGGNPLSTSSTEARVDGLIATAGGDANMSNVNVVTGAVSTVDAFTLTMPASA